MDKTTYIQEAERQLSDCRFYEKLDSDPTLDFTQKIMRALEAMHARGHLDNKTMEYLTQRIPSQAVSICCLKFTRKTIQGDRLYQPMVTELKRYRNLLIFIFGRSLKTFHHTSKILPTT
jgi:hypothetical protein